jgi:threonyl-tRNA synthetase
MRFEAEYMGSDGQKHRPIMIHRVVFGSIERFIGILIEHYAGKFPTWLAPVQVRLLPITDRNNEYSDKVEAALKAAGIRVESDKRQEKTGFKVREAQLQKIPYMLVIGDKEAEDGTVAVRRRDGTTTETMPYEQFIDMIVKQNRDKSAD